jgi:hypothetical protein
MRRGWLRGGEGDSGDRVTQGEGIPAYRPIRLS